MTNVRSIIANYQKQMTAAGLLREAGQVQLSPRVAALRPSLTKINQALAENPDLLRREVQASPLQILFEYTLPKLEPLLTELGEEKAEKIIRQLCELVNSSALPRGGVKDSPFHILIEHTLPKLEPLFTELGAKGSGRMIKRLCDYGEKAVKELGIEKACRHLNELYHDLPEYKETLRKSGKRIEAIPREDGKIAFRKPGLDMVIEAYRRLHFENTASFLRFLGLGEVSFGDDGSITLEIQLEESEADLLLIRKAQRIGTLIINDRQGKNLSPAILKAIGNMKDLRKLHLGSDQRIIPGEGIDHLSGLSNLLELQLNGFSLKDPSLAFLRRMTGLKSLALLYCGGLNDRSLEQIGEFKELEGLRLGSSIFADSALAKIADLKKLRVLDLSGNRLLTEGLKYLNGLTELEELDISNTHAEQAYAMNLVEQSTKLRTFKWQGAKITDNSALGALPSSITFLELSRSTLNDIGLAQITGKLNRLETLLMTWTAFTDNGAAELDKLTALKTLYIGSREMTDQGLVSVARLTSLSELSVASPTISGEGLRQLASLADLESLIITGGGINDHGLTTFLTQSNFRRLQHLALIDTLVTMQCVERFEAILGIKIRHETFSV